MTKKIRLQPNFNRILLDLPLRYLWSGQEPYLFSVSVSWLLWTQFFELVYYALIFFLSNPIQILIFGRIILLKFGFGLTEFKFQSSVFGSGSTEFDFQNSVFGSGSTEFKFQNSVSGSGLTEFKFKNSVSGSGWQNLNSFVPYSRHLPDILQTQPE